jgi:hypothetical protein
MQYPNFFKSSHIIYNNNHDLYRVLQHLRTLNPHSLKQPAKRETRKQLKNIENTPLDTLVVWDKENQEIPKALEPSFVALFRQNVLETLKKRGLQIHTFTVLAYGKKSLMDKEKLDILMKNKVGFFPTPEIKPHQGTETNTEDDEEEEIADVYIIKKIRKWMEEMRRKRKKKRGCLVLISGDKDFEKTLESVIKEGHIVVNIARDGRRCVTMGDMCHFYIPFQELLKDYEEKPYNRTDLS